MGATELSGNLTKREIRKAGRTVGLTSYHRSFTAAAVPNDELGLDIGLEGTFMYRGNLLKQGDNRGVVPRVIPLPRLWLAWDLPADFQISGSFSPGSIYDGVTTFGSALQWVFYRDDDGLANLSVVGGYSYSNAFRDIVTHTTNVAFQASRELEKWYPFAGAGFMVGNTTVRNGRQAIGVGPGPYTIPVTHLYVGGNVEMGQSKFTFQLDLIGTKFASSVLIANRF